MICGKVDIRDRILNELVILEVQIGSSYINFPTSSVVLDVSSETVEKPQKPDLLA